MNLKHLITSLFSNLLYVSTTATTTPTVTAQELQVGDEICTSGYVMDYYCINNGNLVDRPSVRTLQGPDQHSVHCLVDVPFCRESEFEILLPLSDDELRTTTNNGDLYKRGWRVDDEGRQELVNLARSVGEFPSCSTCTGEGSLKRGFHAGVVGHVLNVNGSQGSPILISVNRTQATQPDDDFCATFGMEMIDPPVLPPSPVSGNLNLDENLVLNYVANFESEILSIELILEGQAWLAIGLTDNGSMTGGVAVVGLPDTSVAEKYSLDGYSLDGVQPVAQGLQTLIDATVEQTEEQTILRYSRNFEDEGDLPVDIENGIIRFIYAYGTSNTFGYHSFSNKGSVDVDVGTSIEEIPISSPEVDTVAPAVDTMAPTASPVILGQLIPFSGTLDLDDNLVLNYEGDIETEILSMELILEGQAWLGIGLKDDGKMTGGVAVIGLPDASVAEKYSLDGYSLDGVQPVAQELQSLIDATVEQTEEQTILRYKRNFNDEGDLSVDAESGIIRFIYAYGESNTLAYHTFSNKGSAEVNVILGEAKVDEVIDTESKWKAHGLLMGLAWGVFVPFAIACSLLRHVLPLPPGVWYKLHMGSNSLASVMTVCGIGIAVSAINDEKGDDADHFSLRTHHKIGGIILVLTVLQVMNGFLRPHAPGPHAAVAKQDNVEVVEVVEGTEDSDKGNSEGVEEKTKVRSIWEVMHRLMGVTTLVMAWYNCSSGINLYEGRYPMDMNLTLVFWIIVGVIAGGTLLLKFVEKFKHQQLQ